MRIIAHLDMDAFFASIEEMDNPRFRGLPLVVGADPENGRGRGVVSTANYKAREYGIRSALPISKAWQFSEEAQKVGKPSAIFLPVNSKRYTEISWRIMAILHTYAALVEEASIDEAYADLSYLIENGTRYPDSKVPGTVFDAYEKARKIAQQIKVEIKTQEHLTASIGIGPNKLIAKIASDRQKPDGLTVVTEEEAEEFLEPLSVRAIPGIGPKAEAQFLRLGIKVVRDAKKLDRMELYDLFGQWGVELYDKLRGVSDSPLTEFHEVKSIGEQETFPQDTLDSEIIFQALDGMCGRITKQVKKDGFAGFRTVVLIVRFANFETKTRSHTFKTPTTMYAVLHFEVLKLLMPFLDHRENPRHISLRLIGVRVEKLS